MFEELSERINDRWKSKKKKKLSDISQRECEDRTEAQLNIYRLLLKMENSSKSNGIQFPGFLTSLQQKAGLSMKQLMYTADCQWNQRWKAASGQETRTQLPLTGVASWWLGREPSAKWKQPDRVWKLIATLLSRFQTPQSPRGKDGDQACTTGRPWPVRGRAVKNWRDINTSEGRKQRIKESERSHGS